MTPSILLTAPTKLDTDPLNADCAKRNVALPPFGVIITHPGPSSASTTPTSTGSESECDAYDSDASRTNRTLARQWTGAPIRAIVPLPRRKLVLPNGVQDAARSVPNMSVPASSTAVGAPPCLARAPHFWDDTDTDSGPEIEEGGKDEEEGSIEGRRDAPSGLRYCSYESINAVQGLSAWSFEELRVECYAQSLVARGTKPPPVVQLSLAIPPAFVPRIVPRS